MTKYKNAKNHARKRSQLIAKQNATGGGRLTNQEQKIVDSAMYGDLALKLGNSAIGNDARGDSDAINIDTPAPTTRLERIINTDSVDEADQNADNANSGGDNDIHDLEMVELNSGTNKNCFYNMHNFIDFSCVRFGYCVHF